MNRLRWVRNDKKGHLKMTKKNYTKCAFRKKKKTDNSGKKKMLSEVELNWM